MEGPQVTFLSSKTEFYLNMNDSLMKLLPLDSFQLWMKIMICNFDVWDRKVNIFILKGSGSISNSSLSTYLSLWQYIKSIHSIPISYIIPKKFPESEIKQVGLGLHTILFISVFTISISSYFNPVAPVVSWVILAS